MKTINLIHFGIGKVGRELVKMVLENRKKIKKDFGIVLNYCGVFTSKGGIFNKDGLAGEDLKKFPNKFDSSTNHALKFIPRPCIVVDTTSSNEIIALLETFLKKGAYVVLSNKKPLTASNNQFKKLHAVGSSRLFYETTVGAGLPVIRTLKTLIATGDEVIEISGCFSGTLGFICSALEDGMSFSSSVKKAKDLGFTEADPRDDLSGTDVGRKALILARIIGMNLEMKDIKLRPLFPDSYSKYSVGDFMENTKNLDEGYRKKFLNARKKGNTFRFIAKVSNSTCTVALTEVSKNSDLGNLKGPDNMIIFKTKRYFERPIVIKGPGAGPEVTAAGLLGDILTIGGVV